MTTEQMASKLSAYEGRYAQTSDGNERVRILCEALNFALADDRYESDEQYYLSVIASGYWRRQLETYYTGRYTIDESGRFRPVA